MLTRSDIEYIKQLIIKVGGIAAEYQQTHFSVELKKDQSPVTHADKAISSIIVTALSKLMPHIPVVSEEEEIPEVRDSFWLVDPIDGTKSYIKREKTYTVNIGLIEHGQPTYGFIYQPTEKLLYYTNETRELVVEIDRQVTFSQAACLDRGWKAVVASRALGNKMIHLMQSYNITDITHIPSSIKLCLVADNSVDVYPRFGDTMEWDIAAGHALIKASGGEILDLDHNIMQYAKRGFRNHGFIACGTKFYQHHFCTV